MIRVPPSPPRRDYKVWEALRDQPAEPEGDDEAYVLRDVTPLADAERTGLLEVRGRAFLHGVRALIAAGFAVGCIWGVVATIQEAPWGIEAIVALAALLCGYLAVFYGLAAWEFARYRPR